MVSFSAFKDLGKKLWSFLFSYKGKIDRIQYFIGLILVNVFAYAFHNCVDIVVLLVVEFIYLYVLFAFVQKRCYDINKDSTWMVIGLGISLVSAMIYKQLPLDDNVLFTPYIVGVTIWAILIHMYLLMTAGENNVAKPVGASFLLVRPWILPVIMQLIMAVGIVFGYAWFAKHRALFDAPLVVYTNQQAYTKFCRLNGYKLVNYPQKFADIYADKIEKVEKRLSRMGFPLADILNERNVNNLDALVVQDLTELKHNLILDIIAEQTRLPREGLVWQDDYEDLLSMAQVCRYIDENAEDLIRANLKAAKTLKSAVR